MTEDLSADLAGWLNRRVKQAATGIAGLLVFTFIFAGAVFANDVRIENAEIKDQNTSEKTAEVEFDLSWQNAWSDSVNHDAVWVFFKYSSNSGVTWNHATMKNSGTNPSGFSYGSRASGNFTTLEMVVPADKKGVFIKPGHLGSGYVDFDNLNVVWDYGADGPNDPYATWSTPTSSFQIKAHAIEMVEIPEGGFYAGDGSDGSRAQLEFGGASASRPGAINSEAGMSFGNSATQWYYNSTSQSGEASTGASFEVSEAFPKGFRAFYLMKYELSQGQYTEFLNSLLQYQQLDRIVSSLSGGYMTYYFVMTNESAYSAYRNWITEASNGTTQYVYGQNISFGAGFPDHPANFLTWMDLAAYADWAALRPISELEFEKAARGPLYPVAYEFPWGAGGLVECDAVANETSYYETCTTTNANVRTYGTSVGGGFPDGPLRCGIFATGSTASRIQTGAGYYGNMELAGNLYERVVTLGNAKGRGFAGTHGDGRLIINNPGYSNATNSDWPGYSGDLTTGVSSAEGSGARGGSWATADANYLTISERLLVSTTDATRTNEHGGRLARTAPEN